MANKTTVQNFIQFHFEIFWILILILIFFTTLTSFDMGEKRPPIFKIKITICCDEADKIWGYDADGHAFESRTNFFHLFVISQIFYDLI